MLIRLWSRQARRYDVRTDQMVSGAWRLCVRLRWSFVKGWTLESKANDMDQMHERLMAHIADIRERSASKTDASGVASG